MLRSGLWPLAIRPGEKRPIGTGWGTTAPTREQLASIFGEFPRAGVGLALGPEPGVVDFEIDNPAFALDLPATLGWRSARGLHRVYRWDRRLEGLPAAVHLAGGAAELRLGGEGKQTMSVCPPTVGTDRRRRAWNGVWEIAPLPDALVRALESRAGPKPVRASRGDHATSEPDRYASAALRSELKAVAAATEGTRNDTLNRAAFSLGTLVGAGLLAAEPVTEALAAAAVSAGLPEREARATIRSGLTAGIQRPRKG